MNTKKLILTKSSELFSKYGVRNITLRQVAQELNKSYGNITYHFSTKEEVLSVLANELLKGIYKLNKPNFEHSNSLKNYLGMGELQYQIVKNHLFFYIDFLEIERNYPECKKLLCSDTIWLHNLKMANLINLQRDQYLPKNLNEKALEYLLEIQSGLGVQYLQNTPQKQMRKKDFAKKLNKAIFPYLTEKGKFMYIKS